MNGEQLFGKLQEIGLSADSDKGHVNVLMDVWTGRVLSTSFHPNEDGNSMTVLVASCDIEASHGNLLAGGIPTTIGDPWDTWLDVCNKAIQGATMVATAYTASLFEEIGFSVSSFLESVGNLMSDDDRFLHMNARLNYAATRRFVNKMVAMSMDLEGEDRANALKALAVSDMYMAEVEKILTAVDGQ